MQIRPDVFLVNGRASNLYLCRDDDGLALIDAGLPNEEQLVLAQIAALGYQPQQLTRILITHADIDHVGSLAALQEYSGAEVYAGAETIRLLSEGATPKHLPGIVQRLADLFVSYRPPPATCLHPLSDSEFLPMLGGLQALATPGHTLDHFSYYSPALGILFAGDALQTRQDRLATSSKWITADEDAANDSARMLLALTPALFACGHGRPMDDHDADDLMKLFHRLRADKF